MPSTTRNTGFLNYIYEFCILSNKDYEIILAYEGVINNQTIKAFTSLTEVNMSKNNETEFLQKKVYHVMVEFLQNIIKHASPHGIGECQEYADCHGILVVCHDQNEYHITTGNLIQKSLIPGLSDRISQTNSLSKEELDKHYLSQLKNGHISDEGGAGLGFIDIRRKTGSELIFQFLPVSETHEFFLLTTTIPKKV